MKIKDKYQDLKDSRELKIANFKFYLETTRYIDNIEESDIISRIKEIIRLTDRIETLKDFVPKGNQ